MAKLSAHGTAIGTIYLTTSAKRYMSDGVILKNIGFGWKLYGKVKSHVTPLQAFENQKRKQAEHYETRPHHAAYLKMLHDMAGMDKRWKLHAAVDLMPEDCDGVWSEACDGYGDNIHADVDEVGELCRLYLRAVAEASELRAAAPPAIAAQESANV